MLELHFLLLLQFEQKWLMRAMEGVELLRQSLGREAVDVIIPSSGYGLIPEDKTLVPY